MTRPDIDKSNKITKGLSRPKRKTGKTIKCERCGKLIYKRKCFLEKNKRNFCSIICWNTYQFEQSKRKKEAICPNCGKEFISIKHHPEDNWAIYCSVECYREYHTYSKRGGFYTNCKYCGKKIWAVPARRKDGKDKFCSHDCANAFKTAQNTFFDRCTSCGILLRRVNNRQLYNKYGYFCTKECQHSFLVMKDSPSFKGGWHKSSAYGYYHIWVGNDVSRRKKWHKHRNVTKLRSRVIVELELDIVLRSSYGILRLNGDASDDRLENLYFCQSMSELRRIQAGSLSFPPRSNIKELDKSLFRTVEPKYQRFSNVLIAEFVANSLSIATSSESRCVGTDSTRLFI